MSSLQCVEKVSDTEYVLPPVGDMRVPVRAFLSDALFAQTNEALWRQAASAAAYPGMTGAVSHAEHSPRLRDPGRWDGRDRGRDHPGRQRPRHLLRGGVPAGV